MRERTGPRLARRAATVLGLGVVLGLAGPFSGQPPLDPWVRILAWICFTTAGVLAASATARLIPATGKPLVRQALTVAVSAVPVTFFVAWAITLMRPGHFVGPEDLPALFVMVAALQLLLVLLVIPRRSAAAPLPAAPDAELTAFPPALLAKLPRKLGSDILALESEDHYLRVHTREGSALILMRLSDAIALIDPGLGMQAHRRWWVAAAAIADAEKQGSNLRLRLVNDLTVPVGRTYLEGVRGRLPG